MRTEKAVFSIAKETAFCEEAGKKGSFALSLSLSADRDGRREFSGRLDFFWCLAVPKLGMDQNPYGTYFQKDIGCFTYTRFDMHLQ